MDSLPCSPTFICIPSIKICSQYQGSYLRYSDDIAVFSEEKEKLEEARGLIEQCLADSKLAPHPNKTTISHVAAGIVYLGFFLDAGGKGPAQKSIESLQTRLAVYDKLRRTDDITEKLNEATTVIRGWYNYYKTLKPLQPTNILSLILLVQLSREFGEVNSARELLKQSKKFVWSHPEISFQLGEEFLSFGMRHQAIREYARALELDSSMEKAKERIRVLQEGEENIHQAIEKLQLLLYHNPHYQEGYQRLADHYSQLGLYGFAEKAHRKALEIDGETETAASAMPPLYGMETPIEDVFDYRSVDQEAFLSLFAGRKDAHAKQWVDERGKWGFVRIDRPMRAKDAYAHLKSEITLGVYPVTARDTVHFIVFDIDTAKRVILEGGKNFLEEFRKRAHQEMLRIKSVCDVMGLALYIEDSGYKGRHGWLFFQEELPAAQAIQAGREILKKAGAPSAEMTWELFPMGKSERHQSIIKLPLGINRKNNRRCLFLNPDGDPVTDQALLLRTIKRNEVSAVKQILDGGGDEDPTIKRVLFEDETQPAASAGIQKMISSCKVLWHLISKAKDTNYLNHYERICLLYTLSFAGNDGAKLLHKVISYCINYDYQYTQHQIERRKENPMSCAKIMENFPELAETLPCNCKFNLPLRSYPSPVLYLIESEIERANIGPLFSKTTKKSVEGREKNNEDRETLDDEEPILDFEHIFSSESTTAGETSSVESLESLSKGVTDIDSRFTASGPWDKGLSEDQLRGRMEPDSNPAEEDAVSSSPFSRNDMKAWSDKDEATAIVTGMVSCTNAGSGVPLENRQVVLESAVAMSRSTDEPLDDKSELHISSLRDAEGFDAWEVALEYMRLRHCQERVRKDLENASGRLDRLFDGLDSDTLKTEVGSIRRVQGQNGKTSWILMAEGLEPKTG